MASKTMAEVFSPGEILEEELAERGWSKADLAAIMGRDSGLVSALVLGKRGVTVETARDLSEAFGTSPEFWLRLQAAYDLAQLASQEGQVARRARLFELGPIKDMMKRGWIEESDDIATVETRVSDFFEVSDLAEDVQFWPAAARKSLTYDEPEQILRAWLFRARHLARAVQVHSRYSTKNHSQLEENLRECVEFPAEIRRVPRLLADAGVRLVILEKLRNSRVDGVCFWLDRYSPVIALSMRFDRIDYFWHTLFHELDHVKHGDGKGDGYASVDTNWGVYSGDKPKEEVRADLSASSALVDQEKLRSFIMRVRPLYSTKKILAFARLNRTHPGIVVGQLQHREEIPYSHSRKLLVPVREHLEGAALTDGWGNHPPALS